MTLGPSGHKGANDKRHFLMPCSAVPCSTMLPLKARRNIPLMVALLAGAALWLAPTQAFAQSDDIEVKVKGEASVVTGVVDGNDASDADIRVGVSASTLLENGLEVGGGIEARADGQMPGAYWGAGRYSGLTSGGARGLNGRDNNGDVFVQSAFAYARGGFGYVSVGLDNGVASQLAVSSPNIFSAIGVNDWRTDVTGLNDVNTINDFSGHSTKLTYMPPANLFGGVLGGVQMGLSYTPESDACGADQCAPVGGFAASALSNPNAATLPQMNTRWENILEAAIYYEKTLGDDKDSPRLGVGASYLRADEKALDPNNLLDDYNALSLGVNVAYKGVTLGGSVKNSNAGLALPDSNYLAFDAGITYRTGPWGFMLGYGQADANQDAANLFDLNFYRETQSAQAGVSYALGRGVTLGAAAQFVDSQKPLEIGGNEDVAAVVFESSIKF